MPSRDRLTPGTVLAGKLRVVRLIGEGGMGTVYEVEHEFTKHRRAMKLLHPEMAASKGLVSRFLREASAAGRIGSPHIVETFDAGTLESGEPYIVMELLEGKTLETVIERNGRLDFRESVEIVLQACDGIQAAHDAGIIHRDLKPENLFLLAGDRPFVKILDFGISKFDPSRTGDHKLTQDGTALGTPYYMSPEQVRGQADLDGRTDVYALGVVLYECLTGKKPFLAETLPALAILIHEGKYESVRASRPDAPDALEAVVAKAISVDRDARYATPADFAQALRVMSASAIGKGQTLVAPPTAVDGTRAQGASSPAIPASTGAPNTLLGAAGTDAGVASDSRWERRKPSTVLWLSIAAAAIVGIGALVAIGLGGDAETSAVSQGAPPELPPAPTATPATETKVTPQPTVAPIVSAETGRAAPAASAAPSATAPKAEEQRNPQPTPSAKPSRATEHGLAEENPF